jgi:DegV family protein with EDD domain
MTARPCAVVVDSGAALADDPDHGLAVVPHRVRMGDVEFVDDGHVETYRSFYELLRSGVSPGTSTPSPGEYLEAFKRVDADSIVCLTIPAEWSGMYDAASLAAGMLAGDQRTGTSRVTVIDTGTAAGGLALVARLAATLCGQGRSVTEVLARVRQACSEVRTYGALASLTNVAKSGRVPALVAGISNSLHVRPVFRLFGGETGRVALTRTVSGSINALQRAATEHLNGDPQWVLVFHADAEADAAMLSRGLATATRVARSDTVPLSPIAGAYTGPGTIGFASIPISELGETGVVAAQ